MDTRRQAAFYFQMILAVGFVLSIAFRSAHAQSATAPQQNTEAFRIAYGMSFYGFDGCGDHSHGELYRRAILEKVDLCPFSNKIKRQFRAWAMNASTQEKAIEERFIAEHGKPPDRLDGMKETCEAHRKTPDYLKALEQLDGYSRGKISFEQVVSGPCDTKAAAP